jgi:hypothetical protein
MKAKPLRRAGVLAGVLAGPFFLVSVGLNTWAALVTFISLAGNSWAACRFRGLARWHVGRTVGRRLRPSLSRACSSSSLAATALLVVFLLSPWGNASFLMVIVTLFAWIAVVAVRLATHHS